MQTSSTSTSRSPAALIGIVAGIVIAIGAFLPWAKATAAGVSETAAGWDGWEGKVCVIAGAGIAIRSFMGMTQGRTRQVALAVLIGGLVATGVGVYTAATAKTQLRDAVVDELIKEGVVTDEASARAAVDQAMDSGQIKVSIAFGLFVVIAGGVAAIGAGAMALGAKDAPTSAGAPMSAPTPAGGFGAPPAGPAAAAPSAPAPTESLPTSEPMPPAPPEEPPSSTP